jgi:hypothetical protein
MTTSIVGWVGSPTVCTSRQVGLLFSTLLSHAATNSLQHLYPADNHWIAAGIPFPLHHAIALRSLLVVQPYASVATYELRVRSCRIFL